MLQQHKLQQPRQGGCWPTAPEHAVQLGVPPHGVLMPLASAAAAGPQLPLARADHGQVPQQQGRRVGMQLNMQLQQALRSAERRRQAEKVALELSAMLGEADDDELSSDDES